MAIYIFFRTFHYIIKIRIKIMEIFSENVKIISYKLWVINFKNGYRCEK